METSAIDMRTVVADHIAAGVEKTTSLRINPASLGSS